jgi:hypothetical protein
MAPRPYQRQFRTFVAGAAAPLRLAVDPIPAAPAAPAGYVARIVTYGEESSPDLFGDTYRFLPGSLYHDDALRTAGLSNHDDDAYAEAALVDVWAEGDQVLADFELLTTVTGAQAAAELAANIRTDVSMGVWLEDVDMAETGYDEGWGWPTYRYDVTRAELCETSRCLRGAMPSAQILKIR